MFMRKPSTRLLSRLVAGLFAVQIVVTGFCLLTSQAHAMPMSQMLGTQASASMMPAMGGSCVKSSDMKGHHNDTSHTGGCFHCDEPDQFLKVSTADIAPAGLVFVALAVMPELASISVQPSVAATLQPTGPPRSSSLLFSTTQRIRI